MMIDVPH